MKLHNSANDKTQRKIQRVFVSGYGIVSAFGKSWAELKQNLAKGKNATKYIKEWEIHKELHSKLAVPIENYAPPAHWNRKQMRSLGTISCYAVEAAGLALKSAGLMQNTQVNEICQNGSMGVSSGSSTGSTDSTLQLAKMFLGLSHQCNANTYIKCMPHITAANIAIFYGLKGRIIPTSCACASASVAIGQAYEAIKFGLIDSMIAGGAEELCPSQAYTFDFLYATSQKNATPELTPAPFDSARDGLVIGEAAGFVVLESEDSLKRRGGEAIAEVVGFGSNCDGAHSTHPQSETMKQAMILALQDAGLKPSQIGYVNAHATATQWGDIAESKATNEVFGESIPISSLKSYLGHTLGACGGIESIASIEMMRDNTFYPTINLKEVDKACASLGYLREIESINTDFVMNNNFAFGGINTSLIFKRV